MYLAEAWNAGVEILHVIEGPAWLNADAATVALVERARHEAAGELAKVRDQMARHGLTAEVRQVVGKAHEHICLAARERGADLVILGMQGHTNLLYGLIGSTAERVIKDGPCPVLAVPSLEDEPGRPTRGKAPAVPIQRILAPLDFSSPSLDALEYGVQMANGLGSKLTLMHVLEPVCYDLDCGLGLVEQEAQKRDHWNKQLEELRTFVTSFGLAADVEIAGGMASDVILASALRHRSDLIVMGTHGRRGLSVERFGSVADAVLRRATCPVLTVKAPKFAPNHRRIMPQTMSETETEGAER